MALVFYSDSDRFEPWRDALTEAVPDLEVRNWDEAGDPAEIDFALVWLPPQGALQRFPNLKAILNLGAGVDALLRDPSLPKGVPIVRMVDNDLAKCMAEYVLLHVLRYHREQPLCLALELLRDPVFDALLTGESPFDALPETMARLVADPGDTLCHVVTYD